MSNINLYGETKLVDEDKILGELKKIAEKYGLSKLEAWLEYLPRKVKPIKKDNPGKIPYYSWGIINYCEEDENIQC